MPKSNSNREADQNSTVVSVVIPSRNPGHYLHAAVASVLRQTLSSLELIIVDDDSSDGSIAELGAIRDPRMKIVRPGRLGQTRARLHGIGMARGKYIAAFDADDVCWPDRLRQQVEYLEENKSIVMVGTWARVIDETGTPFAVLRPPCADHEIRSRMATRTAFIHPTVMIRRDAYSQVGGYNPANVVAQDYELFSRLLLVGKVSNLPEYHVDYRAHDNQVTRSQDEHVAAARVRVRRKASRQLRGLDEDEQGVSPEEIDQSLLEQIVQRAIRLVGVGRACEAVRILEAARRSRKWSERSARELQAHHALCALQAGESLFLTLLSLSHPFLFAAEGARYARFRAHRLRHRRVLAADPWKTPA